MRNIHSGARTNLGFVRYVFYAYTLVPIVILLSLLTAVYWWSMQDAAATLRQDTLGNAQLRASQVNSTLSEAVSMTFQNADQTLQTLVDSYLDNSSTSFQKQILMDRMTDGLIVKISVIGPSGYVAYTSAVTADRTYMGDCENFQFHNTHSANQLFIGKPVLDPLSGQWSIRLSRPIYRHGQLQGVMVLSLSPAYLYNLLQKLPQDPQDVVAIVRNTGEVLARNADFDSTIGLQPRVKRAYQNSPPNTRGMYIDNSNIDGIRRLYYWQHLKSFPIEVLVGLSVNRLMQPVEQAIEHERSKARMSIASVWGVSLLSVFLTMRMNRLTFKRRQMEYMVHHDMLTGIANRSALVRQLRTWLQEAALHASKFAVLFIDLDGFKQVNDEHGHAAGDAVLKAVAGRLTQCARNADLVCRIGGDEFVVMYHDVRSGAEIEQLVRRISATLEAPISYDHQTLQVGASIGVAQYPDDGTTVDDLLKVSDNAMYQVKCQRKAGAPAALAAST